MPTKFTPVGRYPLPNKKTGRVGRPPGRDLTRLLKSMLDASPLDCEETYGEKLIAEAVLAACDGDVKFFNSIFDRVEGKPTENMINKGKIEHTIIRKSHKTPVKKKKKSKKKKSKKKKSKKKRK